MNDERSAIDIVLVSLIDPDEIIPCEVLCEIDHIAIAVCVNDEGLVIKFADVPLGVVALGARVVVRSGGRAVASTEISILMDVEANRSSLGKTKDFGADLRVAGIET